MKLLTPTGFARLATAKAAIKYAAHRIDEGCDVKIARDADGMYRVEFEPRARKPKTYICAGKSFASLDEAKAHAEYLFSTVGIFAAIEEAK